jgi:hypothetical protein
MTQTMTQTEASRAYPDCDLPPVGYWIAVTVWTDADGEMTDMLTGAGASEREALADAEQELAAQGADGDYETTAYLLTLPDPAHTRSETMTQTMTQTEASRAYPHIDAPVGSYLAVTLYPQQHGEAMDVVTGIGATAADAWAEAQRTLVEQGGAGAGETEVYLVTLPDSCPCGCGTEREERTCDECGTTATVIDCGHYRQPAAISAMPGGRDLCDDCFAEEEQKPQTPRTAHTEWLADGGSMTVEADWAEAASPITYGIDGEEPTHATVFQVADARHSPSRAIEIVGDWLDGQEG